MKKILVFVIAVISFSYAQAGPYEDGYNSGFSFANQQLEYYIEQHPEYGTVFTYSTSYYQIDQYNGTSQITYAQYVNLNPGNSFVLYTMGTGYSTYQAGQVVINSFYQTGAFDYLQQQASQGPFYQGLYDGFVAGVSFWLMTHS